MINYALITKPGIIMGNLITLIAGFLLASKGHFDLGLFLATFLGLACVIASACIFNNYLDRTIDSKMERTKKRAFVTGQISVNGALFFACFLGMTGFGLLFAFTNLLATALAAIGFCIYVLIYTLWKRKTIYGTAIGSIAGAIPPVVGYCAASNSFDKGAILLFALLVLWQMPHFFAIALAHFNDYSKAELPLLPMKKGILRTKVHMAIYIFGFIIASSLLTYYQYTGLSYLVIATALGLGWLTASILGFWKSDDRQWGKHMFRISLIVITIVSVLIPLDVQI